MACCFQYRLLAAVFGLAIGAALIDARADEFVGPPAPIPTPLDDPFTIRRVLLPADRLATEIERAKQGILVRLTRKDFEKRVRKAALGMRERSTPPRLVEAHYRAKLLRDGLDDNALSGTAEWKIFHGGAGPALMPLDSVEIALRDARWIDNRPALIGILDPRPQAGLSLLVDEPGQHSLALDWTSRGLAEPGELRFDLAVPVSPLASLELELPIGLAPILPHEAALLTGPFPIDGSERFQTWRIAFGGIAHLEISLRAANATNRPQPRLQSSISTKQEISAGSVLSQATLEFRVLHGDVTELIIEHDPDMTLTDVAVNNLESWRALPGIASGRKRINLRLREPARGGQIRVAAAGTPPLHEGTFWSSPTIQIADAIPRGETIRLRVAPDLRMLEWRAGSFRLLKSEFAADRSQIVSLESTLLPENQTSAIRPSARFRPPATEFRVQQLSEWEIAADHQTLTCRLTASIFRGTLSQLSLRLPTGWNVDRVEGAVREQHLNWTIASGDNSVMQIELPRELAIGMEGSMLVRLHRAGPAFARGVQLAMPFPDAVPLGTTGRHGVLTIRVSPTFLASAPPPDDESDVVGPSIPESSDGKTNWTYRYRGRPPIGPLHLSERKPRLIASIDNVVSLDADRPIVTTRLTLKPESGAVDSIALTTTEPVALPWTWRTVQGTNQVLSVRPLPVADALTVFGVIGSPSPFDAATRFHLSSRTRWWRMTFARPLESPLVIESVYQAASPDFTADAQRLRAAAIVTAGPPISKIGAFAAELSARPPHPNRDPVPLLQVAGANSQSGSVTVRIPTTSGRRVETTGMTRDRVRQLRIDREEIYQMSDMAPSMVVRSEEKSDQAAALQVDAADLIIVASRSDTWRCLSRFRIQSGGMRSLPMMLPAGAMVQEIAIAERTLPPDLCRIEEREGKIRCTIPIPAGPAWQRIEILYTVPAAVFVFWNQWATPVPELPATPLAMRIIWRLPPGIVPLTSQHLLRLPGGPRLASRLDLPWLRGLADGAFDEPSGRLGFESLGNTGTAPKDATIRTFAQSLLNSIGTGEKPILDRDALAELDVHPATLFPTGSNRNWESLGFVLAPYGGGTVLTTPRQRSIWAANSATGTISPVIRESLQDAARLGSDASGRFVAVADWLESPPRDHSTLLAQLGGDGPGWTSWEIIEPNTSFRLTVIRTDHMSIAGWVLAAILAVIGVLLVGRLGRTGVFLLLFWLLAATGALIWLPPALSGLAVGPTLAILLIAIISACRRLPRKKEDATVVTRRSAIQRATIVGTTLALVLLIVLAVAAKGDGPEPATVYLVPAIAPDREPQVILATPELLDRLDALSGPRLAINEYAFLRARYTGRGETTNVAEFEASFNVYSFTERATIALPLGDVRLREVLLDGAAAFPKTSATERCLIDVNGKGEHVIAVKFATSVFGSGPDREILFGSPEVAISQLAFSAPQGSQRLRAVNWRGAQSLNEDGKQLQADLGRSRTVQIRWRQPGSAVTTQMRVLESCVWDIDGSAATLFAAFDFRITQGSITSLKITVPPNLDVSRIEVRPEAIGPGAPPTWVKNWSIGPNRVLNVDLQGALSGNLRLLLECIPIRALNTRPLLQFPAAGDVNERESYFAFRLRGLEVTGDWERRGVTDFSAESFLKDVWRITGAENAPAAVTRAFRRIKNENVLLRPTLHALSSTNRGSQELIWWLSDRGAEVRGTSTWGSAIEPLTFVEWEVPTNVTVADVRGVNLQSWLRAGNRIQAWLRDPVAEVSLVWHGSISRGVAPVETIVFDLPTIRLLGVATQTTTLRLRAPDGSTLMPENPASLGTPISPRTDREVAGELLRPGGPGRWQLRAPQSDGVFRILSNVSVAGQRITFATHIDPLLRRDRPHSFNLSLRDSDGWEVDWRLPSNCKLLPRPAPSGTRNWLIDVGPRETEALSLQLNLQRSLTTLREFVLPELTIHYGEHPANLIQRLVLLGSEVREREMLGWRRVTEPIESDLQRWPRERERVKERGGSLWRADSGEARAQILAGPLPLGYSPPVRVALADIEAAPLGDRWQYRASFDLLHKAGAELTCRLPLGSRLVGLALDGEAQQHADDRPIIIAIPSEHGARLLQIAWISAEARWEAPVFEFAGQRLQFETTVWSARARNGERIEVEHPSTLAATDLRRADALLKMATSFGTTGAPEDTTRLAARAARWLRLADASLNGPRDDARNEERGPDGIALADWSARLREQTNALRTPRPRPDGPLALPIREATYNRFPGADAFRRGVPVHWIGDADTTTTDVRIRTASNGSSLPTVVSFLSIMLAVGLLGALMLLLGRSTRPEQVAIVGIIGAIAFGAPEGGLFLVLTLVAVLVRVTWMSSRALRWLGG